MYSILEDLWREFKSLRPAFISRNPHFNFITVHYFWIIGCAIFGSICLYIRGGIKYIDALFLASGCATQSGLNTINLNQLNTWQQIVLYIIPILTNPIAVNSFVVFLRLYWFEKRFQHIAQQVKKSRGTGTGTFSKSKTNADDAERNVGQEERGVNGRDIIVMHEAARSTEQTGRSDTTEDLKKEQNSESGTEGTSTLNSTPDVVTQPQIKFADQVRSKERTSEELTQLPAQRSEQDHIQFLERQRQRNLGDEAVLRIPGPRDADRGIAPEAVERRRQSRMNSDSDALSPLSHEDGHVYHQDFDVIDEGTTRRNITIAEPEHRPSHDRGEEVRGEISLSAHAAFHTLGALRLRKPRILQGSKLHEDESFGIRPKSRAPTFQSIKRALTTSKDDEDPAPYLSWAPTIGRNSAFVDLTESQREELGGIEYRSLKSLALILVCYFVGFSLFGVLCLLPWIYRAPRFGAIVTQDGQGRAWWGLFTANSAFTDLGFTLTPDSMISFDSAVWPLVAMSFLIIIGNTGFPIMLRIIIWVTYAYVPVGSGIWEELKFLLDHPRRCFTLLFPSKATWWLFWILVVLNGMDLIFYIILDLGNTVVTSVPVNIRVLDGWFQAVSTRTAGFAVVNLAALHPAIQVSYLIMMYISVLPIAISVRRTNVYEEKSLGIYGNSEEENEDEGEPSYVGAHLRRQLSFDLWYIFLGFFIISISEGTRLQSNDSGFTMFSVLFEIVSAYGTVGLSLGYPNIDPSFSAEFGVIAKLVIIAMQVRGRHRGLPYELDRAILLPSEHLQEKEALDDHASHLRRQNSRATVADEGESIAPVARKGSARPSNFLGTLLHPGPTIPNSHRNRNQSFARRHSIGPLPSHGPGVSLEGAATEGRRTFVKDGSKVES